LLVQEDSMKHFAALVLLVGLGVRPGLGQAVQATEPVRAAQADSATLEAILTELRGIHNDERLNGTTQILLTEMVMQQGVVTRVQQKRDDAKNRVSQVQDQERAMATQAARFEDSANATIDPVQKKQMTQMEDQMKQQVTNLKAQEPDRANDLQDAETALRKEQDTLSGIQDELNDVVRKLQPAAK
jgi:hypothetical protein